MLACKKCRTLSPMTANFCHFCGEKILSTAFQVSDSSVERSKQVPKVVYEKYLKAQEAIEGSRRLVTVMFADLNGFTALCERLDPEAVRELINKYFSRLGEVVYEFEGYIDKFIGDCIMALFGAPIAHENDPELAVRAALKMIEELKKMNAKNNIDLSMSIGINSGIVIAGGVGTDLRFDFTVIGDSVNLAQRLGSMAGKDQIFVGRSVFKYGEKLFDFEILPPLEVKGKEVPVEAFSVLGFKQPKLVSRVLVDGPLKLIGRDREISSIQSHLETVRRSSKVLMVSGDPGTGKSRLKFEMRKLAQAKRMEWHEAKSSELQQETPYFPFVSLLRSICKMSADQTKASASAFDRFSLDRTSKFFLQDFLKIAPADDLLHELNPNQKKHASFVAFKKLFAELAKGGPLAFFIDDLHWADPLSIELLSYLIDDLPKKNIFISGAYRNELTPPWQKKTDVQTLQLKPLSAEEAVKLTREILDLKELPEPLVNFVNTHGEGNPLFIQEMIKNLIDGGQISRQGDRWVIPDQLELTALAPTLQGMVAARIDRLDQSDREVLQYASVIGRQFSDIILERALGRVDGVFDSLQFLRKRELVFESAHHGSETEYIFNHILTQQVAYGSILLKQRKLVHESVGKAIESLLAEGKLGALDEHLAALARHYREAGSEEKAVQYLQRQAKRLAESYSNLAAIKNYQTAIELIEKSPNVDRVRSDLCFELAEIYFLMGQYSDAEKLLSRVLEIGKLLQDGVLFSRVYRRLGDIERLRGQKERALYFLNLAIGFSKKAGNFEQEVRAYKSMGNAVKLESDFAQAVEFLKKGLEGARKLGDPELISECLNDLGATMIAVADLDSAEKVLNESKEIAEQRRKRSMLLSAMINLGVIQFMRNDVAGAANRFREAALNAQTMGDLMNTMTCHHNLGMASLELARYSEALPSFEQSYQIARDMGNHLERVNNLIFMGYTKALMGQRAEGIQMLTEALQDAERLNHGPFFCEGKILLARLFAAEGKMNEAKAELAAAQEKASALKNRLILQKCRQEIERLARAG